MGGIILIEWDGMADRNFVTKLQVKFNGDDFQVLNNNYIARTNLNINNKVVFTLEAHYTESPDVDYQWINSKLFSITPTVAKRFTPSNFADRLKGKLLLQVEDRGRIWYVNPDDAQKHEVTFANALPLFQKFALGITNKDLNSIPLNNENGASSIGNRLKGKLLLQVEDKGRIWYVDFNGKKWEVTWANLMNLFQKLALGITNADLEKIQEGSLE